MLSTGHNLISINFNCLIKVNIILRYLVLCLSISREIPLSWFDCNSVIVSYMFSVINIEIVRSRHYYSLYMTFYCTCTFKLYCYCLYTFSPCRIHVQTVLLQFVHFQSLLHVRSNCTVTVCTFSVLGACTRKLYCETVSTYV